jgi:hypothetical protein
MMTDGCSSKWRSAVSRISNERNGRTRANIRTLRYTVILRPYHGSMSARLDPALYKWKYLSTGCSSLACTLQHNRLRPMRLLTRAPQSSDPPQSQRPMSRRCAVHFPNQPKFLVTWRLRRWSLWPRLCSRLSLASSLSQKRICECSPVLHR